MQFTQVRKQMKKQAHQLIKTNYSKLFLVYLPLMVLTILSMLLKQHTLLLAVLGVLSVIVTMGTMPATVHLLRDQVPSVPYIKMAFSDFHHPHSFKAFVIIAVRLYWLLILATVVKLKFPMIGALIVLVWFFRYLQLSMAPYIYGDALANHQPITSLKAVRGSSHLMKSHLFEYFMLDLSLIGWAILIVIPFTAGLFGLYSIPYLQLVIGLYYIYLTKRHPAPVTNNNPVNGAKNSPVSNQPQKPNKAQISTTKKAKKGGLFSSLFGSFKNKKKSNPQAVSQAKLSGQSNQQFGLKHQPNNMGLKTNNPTPQMNQPQQQPTMNPAMNNTNNQNNNQFNPQMNQQINNNPVNNMKMNLNTNQTSAPQQSQLNQFNNQANQSQTTGQNSNITTNNNQNNQVSPATLDMDNNPDNPMNNSSWQQQIQKISQKYDAQPQANQSTNPAPQQSAQPKAPDNQMAELKKIERAQHGK